uniref:GAG-pre-integrase domain-containing protein n=1 Tax=Tanacetum cinerariifolium TaxID=118510 RepID=A0A699IP91_TANCI|nr:hypothetical protein [Tanacetum cinerariifolium]
MLKAGVKPNEVTYIAVLLACSHVGMVDEGLKHFSSMYSDHKITPKMEHYACVVDLLGRSGSLDKAVEFIKSVPLKADALSTTIEGDVSYSQRLTTILLNEFNYLPWSRAITIALGGRSRLGVISGKDVNPDVTSPEYEAWLSKDQMVMSWILNSMERNIAEIFSYSESSKDLWKAVRDTYGNQNNSAHIFQIQLDIANLGQDGNTFLNLLGKLKGLWNELEVYRPHSVDPKILRKRHEDDQVFQLLASLARVYSANASLEKKPYKGKHSDMKCGHCNVPGHSVDRYWILHPELKPKFTKDKKWFIDKRHVTNPKAHMASHTTKSFSSSPVALLNEFANYLQEKHGQGGVQDEATSQGINKPVALLSKFSSFLSNSNCKSSQGILLAFMSALEFSNLHDFWIVDSGATDHISNKLTNVSDFIPFPNPSFVFVANGKGARVLGKGKIKLVSKSVESNVLYDPVTKRMIGEGFLINGLYYFFPDQKVSQDFQAYISPNNEHILWHRRLGHPSEYTFSKITPCLPKGMHDCESCHYSKSTRLPFNSSLSKTDQAFELIHSDVWGPFPCSLDGFKYFVTFIDDFSKKGYTCYDAIDGRLYVSRDVRFLERSPSPPSHNVTQEHEHSSQDSIERPPDNATQEHENSLQDSTSIKSSTNNSFPDTNDLQTEVPRRNPQRDRQPHAKMNDYVSYTTKYPIDDFLTYKKLSPSHAAFLTDLSNVHDPKTFQEAQSQDVWRKAMQEELVALVENKT